LWIALLAIGVPALLGLLIILGIAAWVAHNMTLVRRFDIFGHPSELGLAYEDVTFPSRRDGVTLKGWYLRALSESRCIIIAAGEEHHRNSPGIKPLLLGRDLVARGFNVVLRLSRQRRVRREARLRR